MEVITSTDNKKIKNLCKLKEKKYRDEENLFLVETKHLIEEANKCGLLLEVIILDGEDLDIDVLKTYVSLNVMKKLSFISNSKYIGVVKKYEPYNYNKRLLLLDNIQDPGNLGTIIRSASAFNIDTVVLGDNCVDLYNDKVIRASEGMLFQVDCMRKNLSSFIDELKENNYLIIGTNVINGINVTDFKYPDKFAIIIGNEGKGISDEIKTKIDKNIYIPMNKKTESLNASVAASIIMYEMSKMDYE